MITEEDKKLIEFYRPSADVLNKSVDGWRNYRPMNDRDIQIHFSDLYPQIFFQIPPDDPRRPSNETLSNLRTSLHEGWIYAIGEGISKFLSIVDKHNQETGSNLDVQIKVGR